MIARESILTVLDFESTGSVRGMPEEPWQIGMIELKEGRVTGRHYESFLCILPGRPFNPYAPGRHAELRELLVAAPAPADCWPEWRSWIENRPLAAHNAGTEKKFLGRAAPMHRLGPWIDTLKIVRRIRPDLECHALSDVCEALGVMPRLNDLCPGRTWHDALYDAFACGLLLEHCLALPGWETVSIEALANI